MTSAFDAFVQQTAESTKPASKDKDVFKPPTFKEFVGQERIKELLDISIKAADNEHRPLPNIMFVGHFGLGKSTLANLTLKEAKLPIRVVDGASVNKNLPIGTLIIDEIHNLLPETCDSLNIQLDEGNVHIVGCTTNLGVLPEAFRSRFRVYQLERYSAIDLLTITRNICNRKRVTATDLILIDIAKRARENPRHLRTLLSNIFDYMAVKHTKQLTNEITAKVFRLLGVDEKGYLERDKQYVAVLPDDQPVGLNWLSARLGIDSTTIQEEIEPYLLRTGVIDRTPKGRLKIRDI